KRRPEAGAAEVILAPIHERGNDLRPLTDGNGPEGEVEIVPTLFLEIEHRVGARGAIRPEQQERNRKQAIEDSEPPIEGQDRPKNAAAVLPDPVADPAAYFFVQLGFYVFSERPPPLDHDLAAKRQQDREEAAPRRAEDFLQRRQRIQIEHVVAELQRLQ